MSGETYLENEIIFLEKEFAEIFIICSSQPQPIHRYFPSNAKVLHFNDSLNVIHKIASLKLIFSNTFWKEMFFIRNTLRLPITILKIFHSNQVTD